MPHLAGLIPFWTFVAASALAALAYLPSQNRKFARRWLACLKPVCALVLSSAFLVHHPQIGLVPPFAVSVIFLLFAAGDAALLGRNPAYFLGGLVLFLAGHVCLTVLIAGLWDHSWDAPVELAVLVFPLGVVSLWLYSYLWSALNWALRVAVFLYISAIVAMVLSAAVLADADGDFAYGGAFVLAGALSFAASDAVLAVERFKVRALWMGYFIWGSYALALVLIALGLRQLLS